MGTKVIICSNCGTTLSEKDKFCYKCGVKNEETELKEMEFVGQTHLNEDNGSKVKGKEKNSKSRRENKGLGKKTAVAVVFILCCVCGLWYYNHSKKPNNSSINAVNNSKTRVVLSQKVSPSDKDQSFGDTKIKVTIPGGLIEKEESLTIRERLYDKYNGNEINVSAIYDVKLGSIHELNGVMEIDIACDTSMDGIGAVYYDDKTKEWVPILASIDKNKKSLKIYTDHLTNFTVVKTAQKLSPTMKATYLPSIYDYKFDKTLFNEVLSSAKNGSTGTGPAVRAGFQASNEWFDLINRDSKLVEMSIGEIVEMPTLKKINGTAEKIGYGMIFLQLTSDLSNPDKSNLEATWNFIKNVLHEVPSTNAHKAMSIGVFYIDYSLNKFGETAIEQRYQINDRAYHVYYEKFYKGRRNGKQWYSTIMDIVNKSKNSQEVSDKFDAELNRYVNEFWTETDTMGIAEAYQQIGVKATAGAGLSKDVRDKISNNYKRELLGYLQPVLNQVKKKIMAEQSVKVYNDLKELMNEYNKVYTLKVQVKGEANKIANLPVKIQIGNSETQKLWQGTTDKNGAWNFNFTLYGYFKCGAAKKVKLSLLDDKGTVVKELEQPMPKLNYNGATEITFTLDKTEETTQVECYCGLHKDYSSYQKSGKNSGVGREIVYYFDPKSYKQEGVYKKYLDGKVIEVGCMHEGKKHGKWVTHFDNGQLEQEVIYNNEVKIGKWVLYYNNGYKHIDASFNDKGEKDGEEIFYNESNGKINSYTVYKNGQNHGIQTWYYESGIKREERNYLNGKKNGLETKWDESGRKIWEASYTDDKEDWCKNSF